VEAVVERAVVRIDVHRGGNKNAIGSGFIVSEDGMLVTNWHVANGAKSATATFNTGATVAIAGILASDQRNDIAILKLRVPQSLPVVRLSPDEPKKAEHVIAIGMPVGLDFTVTEGIISAIRPPGTFMTPEGRSVGTWLQTSAPISGGNSGGPLVNGRGDVVGMNTASIEAEHSQNLNLAISAKDIDVVVKKARNARLVPYSIAESKVRGPGF
jgi:S1-C subfamily serine protease